MTSENICERLKVLISYSRNDLQFVDRLTASLDSAGFEVLIDRWSIVGGDDWTQRLWSLIQVADTIIFVLSQASVTSEICEWERSEVERLGKRVVPIVCCDLGTVNIPGKLGQKPNAIYFYEDSNIPSSGFATGFSTLVRALRADFEWIREHTLLGNRARRWTLEGHSTALLLNGTELQAAKHWLSHHPTHAPEPSELQRAYITASSEDEASRAVRSQCYLNDVARIQTLGGKELEQLAYDLEEKRRVLGNWEKALEEKEVALKAMEVPLLFRETLPLRSTPKPRGTKIFISYRRFNCLHIAGRIYDRLERDFSHTEIFFDVDAIPVGTDFREHMRGSIQQSAVLLAVIGSNWANPAWLREGLWRAAAPAEDFVQTELELAFQYGITITPVLIDQTAMPERRSLPRSIVGLCDLHAASVRGGRDFHADMGILCDKIRVLRSQV